MEYSELKFDTIFLDKQGTFVLFDYYKNSYSVYNSKWANTEYPVHSTSKIVWSILGLEEALIKNENEITEYDCMKYPKQDWWFPGWAENHTIVTALNKSVNWYFMELLSSMSPQLIEKYLDKFDYKNGFKVERVQYYRLTSDIKKSALEQIDFLKRFYTNELKISDKTHQIVKQGLIFQKTNEYTVFAKTGVGPVDKINNIGWFIGFIEKSTKVYFFALNILDKDPETLAKLRVDYTMKILKNLEII